MDSFPRSQLTSYKNTEVLQALELLLLFNENQSELNFTQICEGSKTGHIPAILRRLQLLESGSLLERELASGKAVWKITPMGCYIRDKVKEIMDTLG